MFLMFFCPNANLKECLLNQLKAQEPPDDILLHLRPLEREMKTACIRRAQGDEAGKS